MKLLSSDINEMYRATNNFIVLSTSIIASTDIEIPRLRENGLEIVAMINAEYGR